MSAVQIPPIQSDEFISWMRTAAGDLAREPAEDAGYALPSSTLKLLAALVQRLAIKRVFEFGSGRSTATFLSLGCHVASLEDSEEWLEKTMRELSEDDRSRWNPFLQPLQTRLDGVVPFYSWKLNAAHRQAVSEAELVLIDSPAHPPSRELALLDTLRAGHKGIIVMDDAGIPTLRRFCDRLTHSNPELAGAFLDLDHGLYVMNSSATRAVLCSRRGILESAKAWRRFLSTR
jgi:hypothetical protein